MRPAYPLPPLRLVAPQRRPLVLHLRARMEHVRHGRSMSRVPPSVEFDAVPFVQGLVAAFGLVC